MVAAVEREPGRHDLQSAQGTLDDLRRQAQNTTGVVSSTGFHPLDEVLGGGIRPGELFVVGGKPGAGKTILTLQWAREAARRGVPAVYVCYEHDRADLLSRLLRMELGEVVVVEGAHREHEVEELQSRLRDFACGALSLSDVVDSDPLLAEAERRVSEYADNLLFLAASGATTEVPTVADAVEALDDSAVVFVDYVQKVPVLPHPGTEDDRLTEVVQGLKEMALTLEIPVVAVTAATGEGLTARRLHAHHFRGAGDIAYEADAILVLNEKTTVVSQAHIAYAPLRVEEFSRQVVFSIEKNRSGVAGVDLEFTKHFAHYRFDPLGSWVTDHLWSEYGIET